MRVNCLLAWIFVAFPFIDGKPAAAPLTAEEENVLNMAVERQVFEDTEGTEETPENDYDEINFGGTMAADEVNMEGGSHKSRKSKINTGLGLRPDMTGEMDEEPQLQLQQQYQHPQQQQQLRRPFETDWGLGNTAPDTDLGQGNPQDGPGLPHQEREFTLSQDQQDLQQQQQQQQEQIRMRDQQQQQYQIHQGLQDQQFNTQQQQQQPQWQQQQQLQQRQQFYEQQKVQQQPAGEVQYQQPRGVVGEGILSDSTIGGSDANMQDDFSQTGRMMGNQEPAGVLSPESMVHGEDVHSEYNMRKQPGGEYNDIPASENEELRGFEPQVLPNVHDNAYRHAVDVMKGQQFRPLDIESVLHSGHDVHGSFRKKSDFRAGDMENAIHGGMDVHDGTRRRGNLGPDSTIDPEQLMHGSDHVHNPQLTDDDKYPGVETPEELFHRGQDGDFGHDHHGNEKLNIIPLDRSAFKPNVEMAVHGQEHVHDQEDSSVPSHKVTYKDIQALGLEDDMLKGIDLSKLLEADQQDFEDWARSQGDESFWTRAKELREEYLTRLTSHIRDIQPPDLENAEWDPDFDPRDRKSSWNEVHAGESPLEHQMEMVGNTAPRGNQRPFQDKFHQQRMERLQRRDIL